MSQLSKRATIYFDPNIHKALKYKALEESRSLSELVHEALMMLMRDDEADIRAINERKNESTISYEDMLTQLKQDGLL